jgi:hypothetical protein
VINELKSKLSWLKNYGHDPGFSASLDSKRWSAFDSIAFELITLNSILFYDHSKRFNFIFISCSRRHFWFQFIDFYRKFHRNSNGKSEENTEKLSFCMNNCRWCRWKPVEIILWVFRLKKKNTKSEILLSVSVLAINAHEFV